MDKRYDARDLLDAMNHYRHDWMNDLQVLFGYIQLNKADKLKAYVEHLSDKLYRESLVAKLGISELVAYLLLFRSKSRKLELVIRPEREIVLANFAEGSTAAKWMISFIQAYEHAVDNAEYAGKLMISMDLLESDELGYELIVHYEYSGTYRMESLIEETMGIMESISQTEHASVSRDYGEQAADIELRMRLTLQ